MKIYLVFERFFKACIQFFWILFITIHEYKKIFIMRKYYRVTKLTEDQKKQIDAFYLENYGQRVPYTSHRLFQRFVCAFDVRYFPDVVFSTRLDNRRQEILPFENKNMLIPLFGDLVTSPRPYLLRMNGVFFDEHRDPVSRERAVQILAELSQREIQLVIKKTRDTNSGADVHICKVKDSIDLISGRPIWEIIEDLGKEVSVQEYILQHETLSRLYPHSVNTVRVVTYFLEEGYFTAPLMLRMGQKGHLVDNIHYGGVFIGLDQQGFLDPVGHIEYDQRLVCHPDTQTIFEGYQIPKIPEMIELAKKLHRKLAMIRFISWDFTVNEREEIVLIEMNLHSQTIESPQIAHCEPIFGENTAAILRLASKKRRRQ